MTRPDDEHLRKAMNEVRAIMNKTGLRYIAPTVEMGNSRFIHVITENELPTALAPPEYVEGVYVAFDRVSSLDYWLGPRPSSPPAPRP